MIRKILAWIAGGIVAFGVVLYILVILVNLHDREPSTTSVRLAGLYRGRPPVADEFNAYIYLMGFNTAGTDPHSMGRKRIAWMQAGNLDLSLDAAHDPLGNPIDCCRQRDAQIQRFINACRGGNAGCVAVIDSGDDIYHRWLTYEGWILERYRALIAHTGWREFVSSNINAPLPDYARALDGQMLLLLQGKVLADKADYTGLKMLLREDLRFWRLVLASSDTLISKMIATAAIKGHFKLGNLVLRQVPADKTVQAMPEEWHVAISDIERSLQRCLVGEWIFTSGVLRNLQNPSFNPDSENDTSVITRVFSWATPQVFQPQDSINTYGQHSVHIGEILDVPLHQYESAVHRITELAKHRTNKPFLSWSAYNPVGQILISVGMVDFASYARRAGDIEGVRRAALAAISLRNAGVSARKVPEALRAIPLRNPYNAHAFAWDAKLGAIVFHGLETGERGRHEILY